jgi:hypothetical protein
MNTPEFEKFKKEMLKEMDGLAVQHNYGNAFDEYEVDFLLRRLYDLQCDLATEMTNHHDDVKELRKEIKLLESRSEDAL